MFVPLINVLRKLYGTRKCNHNSDLHLFNKNWPGRGRAEDDLQMYLKAPANNKSFVSLICFKQPPPGRGRVRAV